MTQSLVVNTSSLTPVDQLYIQPSENEWRLSPVDELWILEVYTGESRLVVWSPSRDELESYLQSHRSKFYNIIKLDRKNRVLESTTPRERQDKALRRCRDWLYRKAVDYVVRERVCSLRSLCAQLCVKGDIAAQLIEFMVEDKIIARHVKEGSRDGNRDVLLSVEEWEEMRVGFSIVPSPENSGASARWRDHLYDDAIKIVIRERRGSVSLLQRFLSIGYGRAARMIDLMTEDGILGEAQEGAPRDVLLTEEQWKAKGR